MPLLRPVLQTLPLHFRWSVIVQSCNFSRPSHADFVCYHGTMYVIDFNIFQCSLNSRQLQKSPKDVAQSSISAGEEVY